MDTATFNIPNYTPLHSKSPIELIICLPPSFVHILCRWTHFHRRQPIWLHRVSCLAHNIAQKTMWEHLTIMLEIQQAKTLNSGNAGIKFIPHRGIVTHLRSYHFQALPSFTTLPHSTWHQARNQTLVVQPQDIRVMGHLGKDTTSPNVAMVDLKGSPFSKSPDRDSHLLAHLKSFQHRLETIQSIGRHCPPLLHRDKFSAHLGDLTLATPRNDFSRQQNCTGQMWQGLRICTHYQRFLMTNSMQMLRAMIRRTWVGLKANPHLAWSKRNSPWSNLPKGWGSPTLVHSTSGRKNGWLGFSRKSIGLLSRGRTVWNRCEMDPCTGSWRLKIFWRLSRLDYLWNISIMPNGFGNNGWWCFWRYVEVRFARRRRREGEATSNRRRIWESARAKNREVMSESCQIQLSWL